MPYSYDRRAGAKVPLTQRSPKEQVRYHTDMALRWLKGGAPSGAVEYLQKALALVGRDPSLKHVHPLLTKAIADATGPDPRSADSVVEKAVALLKPSFS